MRSDHVEPGQRVQITGGKHRGKVGTVKSVRLSDKVGNTGYLGMARARATIDLDAGGSVEAMPRWMELEE